MVDLSVLKYCETFCKVIAPSGYEDSMSALVSRYMQGWGYSCVRDVSGNLICRKEGAPEEMKVALVAHMDSAAIIINGFEGDEFYWGSLSKWKSKKINSESVTFLSGATATAFCSEEGDGRNTLRVDSGRVDIGDIGTLTPCFYSVGDAIKATFLDDRIGCSILVDVARKLRQDSVGVSFIFTVQEEIGNKGARKIAQEYSFDEVYIIDTTKALSEEYNKPIYPVAGNGACIKICDGAGMCTSSLVRKLVHIAELHNISFQKEVLFRGGSDISAFARHSYRSSFAGISIPCSNMHSRYEGAKVSDIVAAEDIVICVLREMGCDVI